MSDLGLVFALLAVGAVIGATCMFVVMADDGPVRITEIDR